MILVIYVDYASRDTFQHNTVSPPGEQQRKFVGAPPNNFPAAKYFFDSGSSHMETLEAMQKVATI